MYVLSWGAWTNPKYLNYWNKDPRDRIFGGIPDALVKHILLAPLSATLFTGSNLTGGSQPAKLPSFGGYSLETLTLPSCSRR